MKTDRDKFLTQDEANRLIQEVQGKGSPRDFVLHLLGLNLGLRVGELVRLRVEDFDRARHVALVPTLKRLSNREKAEKRKSKKAGIRWRKKRLKRGELPELRLEVTLADEVFAELEKYIALIGLDSWLFPSTKDDSHMSARQAQRIFKSWVQKLGFSSRCSIHALRHSRGVDLYERGLDLVEIRDHLRQERLGSTSFYLHLSPARQEKMLAKVGSMGLGDVAKR